MSNVRMATAADIDRCVELGAEFLVYGPYAEFPLDREAFAGFLGGLIDKGVVFLSDDGMIGGLLNPLFFNPSIVMGAELFWWAPKGGRPLREAFEQWALDNGAVGLQFSGLFNERRDTSRKLFERVGFRPTEVAFLKVFQ